VNGYSNVITMSMKYHLCLIGTNTFSDLVSSIAYGHKLDIIVVDTKCISKEENENDTI
jgi:hypothetical protein